MGELNVWEQQFRGKNLHNINEAVKEWIEGHEYEILLEAMKIDRFLDGLQVTIQYLSTKPL